MKFFNTRKLAIPILTVVFLFSTYNDTFASNSYKRISGLDRTMTSVETSKENKSDTLVVAPGYNFSDILSATNLVNKYNAKLILYTKESEFGKIGVDNNIKRIFIVYTYDSYDNYIPYKIDQEYSGKADITRIIGRNKYETNKKTLKLSGYNNVGVATGENYPDALCAYPLLKEKQLGLMLVRGNLPYYTTEYNVVYTFGGPNSVIQDEGERIFGKDRYETSIKIAEKTKNEDISFVDGKNYADSLSAVNIVNSKDTDILLIPRYKIESMSKLAKAAKNIFVVGGVESVQDIYINQILK